MKVYIVTDLEGVAGITQWDPRHQDETPFNAHKRMQFSRLLTEEVNAAARGFFAAGARPIVKRGATSLDRDEFGSCCGAWYDARYSGEASQ